MIVRSLAPGRARARGTRSLRLVRAEIMKIRTTRSWWLFLAGFTLFTAAALTSNGFSHHYLLYPQQNLPDRAQALAQAARARTPAGAAAIAASMMTSGQVLSVLFVMLLGMRAATDEFAQHTAAVTFMTVPRRARAIVAKLTAVICLGALFWLVATVASGVTTAFFLNGQHLSTPLASWTVIRPVLLSLLAFATWAILGLSLGTLIRSPAAAVIAGLAGYAGGFAAAELISRLIYNLDGQAWILGASVIAPAVATEVMISPGRAFPHAPASWAGALIMAGYALALAAAAISVIRRRDVT
jgi:ABC-2 type transport system permease protein